MRNLSDTIRRIQAGQVYPAAKVGGPRAGRLVPFVAAASNPGDLKAWSYVPEGVERMPLVVVLHGCTQSAADYDLGSGWSALAERHGFAVLFPEQQRANNPNLCFNWFSPDDVRRGSGEVLSIREMVTAIVERHAIDPDRVFVTGLSAGGAMASALLAGYPEVFAGGAIIAGLPAGAASTMPQAFERMRGQGHVEPARYADHVREASDHRGPWPTVSVWHGSADATVAPNNAEAILGQWRMLHGVALVPDRSDAVDGAAHRAWLDDGGHVCLEDYRIDGMGHGTPLATSGDTACGSPGAYMLDVGISSTWHSAAKWGLLDSAALASERDRSEPVIQPPNIMHSPQGQPLQAGIQEVIEAALKSAGLMR